jgi:hypothetical protein
LTELAMAFIITVCRVEQPDKSATIADSKGDNSSPYCVSVEGVE